MWNRLGGFGWTALVCIITSILLAGSALSRADSLTLPQSNASSQPAEGNPHVWAPHVTSVAVFKNGYGFFIRSGKAQARDGWCVAGDIPPATFGTLAIFSEKESQYVDVVGSGPGEVVEFNGTDAPKDPAARHARLQASKGLKVQLTYKVFGVDQTAAGTLVSIGPEYVVLENTGQNSLAVPTEAIDKLQVLDLPLRVHVSSDGKDAAGELNLGMAYLRGGVTWVPEYTLKMTGDDTAELTLRGTIINAAEDLIHTDVNFVVGVPSFEHAGLDEPLTVGQVIRTMAASLMPGSQMQQMIQNGINTGQLTVQEPGEPIRGPAASPGAAAAAAMANLPVLDSAAGSDFTVYTKKDLTVRCGEKAMVTLFVKTVHYSHVYRWNPPAGIEHLLVLHNDTDTAFTTGPCLAISGDRPLTEAMLKYTPKGGEAFLPVTAAINVSSGKSEQEIDRKQAVYSPQKEVTFDLVTLKGQLKIQNHEKTAITIEIATTVPGKPTQASDDGALSINSDKLVLRDREGTVKWTLKLKPDEEKTVTYQYERFVPSN